MFFYLIIEDREFYFKEKFMNPEKYVETQSSLLVPAKYMDEFNRRTTGFSRRKYLHALLNRYRNVILWGTFEKMDRVKKAYQEVGQNLQKKNFTPNNADWIDYTNIPRYSAIKPADYVVLTMPFLTFIGDILLSRYSLSAVLSTFDLSESYICK